ncbi:20S-pre-rRNA D-site endonuclease nob1 [Basidiobolus ranarum]|uniref:20S-pre-rRNA D-site endonuclease NOB1 n=1 Tax=Basidiobolus ranarum TaxID=34480 RepID=A0ABR2X3T4_9FUNG
MSFSNNELPQEPQKVNYLIVDSGPILKGAKIRHLADHFYTIPEVFAEIRDKQSRLLLAQLPFDLKVRIPSDEALHAVASFSRKTGDYATLSAVDLKVLALAYMFEKEEVGVEHLRTEPVRAETQKGKIYTPKPEEESPEAEEPTETNETEENSEDVSQAVEDENIDAELSELTEKVDLNEASEVPASEAQPVEEEEDDDEGWITPDNIAKFKRADAGFIKPEETVEEPIKVACITTDFAMQNVLLQQGLKLISIDGILIKRIKTWVLRCHACFKVTTNMEKKFCPSCGNSTLMRTSTSVDEFGNVRYYLKKNFQYNNRGTQFSIPLPKSGKKSNNIILREDQREYEKALKFSRKKDTIDVFDPDYIPKLISGAGRDSNGMPTIGYGKKNPNQARRRTGRKKH